MKRAGVTAGDTLSACLSSLAASTHTAAPMSAPRSKSPPAPAREQYHHGDLRRALVDACAELAREHDVEHLTLREAARRVGVNHRAAYRHFASKEDLLAAVAEQGWWLLVESQRRALEHTPGAQPAARLRAYGVAYVDFAVSHPGHTRVMFGPRLNEDGRFPALEVPLKAAISLLEVELRRLLHAPGAEAPSERAVRDAGIALWAAMHGVAVLVQQRRIRVKPERLHEYAGRLLEPTLRGLAL